jgi:Inorganic pyrophosphatase
MDFTEKPEYGRVVDICTRDSLRELATPGLLAILTPIAVGFAFGYAPLGAYLVGTIAAGVLMAVFLANSGGAWDNAKKLVEDGQLRRQGQRGARGDRHRGHRRRPVQGHRGPGHQPADQGDEPGVAAGRDQLVKYSHNTGLRIGVALGAVAIVVVAIVISKRRSTSLSGSGSGDGAAIGGAQGPDGAEAAGDVPGTKSDSAVEQTPQATG